MDRIEIPMEGEVARWVEAAERGDEVVITQDGEVVAEVKARPRFLPDKAALERLRASVPAEFRNIDWAAEIRAMRDEERF